MITATVIDERDDVYREISLPSNATVSFMLGFLIGGKQDPEDIEVVNVGSTGWDNTLSLSDRVEQGDILLLKGLKAGLS